MAAPTLSPDITRNQCHLVTEQLSLVGKVYTANSQLQISKPELALATLQAARAEIGRQR